MALKPQQSSSSLPGLTRQSMGRNGIPQPPTLWRVSMDARVKPAHDEA
jgi:hypothetical protein